MERSFAMDLSAVRIHQSRELEAHGAAALTGGDRIYFALGRYSPRGMTGQKLLAHELTHVAQQRLGRVRGPSAAGGAIRDVPTLEAEADRVASRVAGGLPAEIAAPGAEIGPGGGGGGGAVFQPMWILRDGQRVEVPDGYELQPGESLAGMPKRKREEASSSSPEADLPESSSTGLKRPAVEASPAQPTPNALDAFTRYPELQGHLFQHLSVPDTMRLGQVSRPLHEAVQTGSVVPHLQGKRSVGGHNFWSTDPIEEDKRYFKPMSGLGVSADVPHISEQIGHPSHLTDVAAMHWDNPHSSMGPGLLPSKLQFQQAGPASPSGSYTLGAVDTPVKPQAGRVLTHAPPEAGEYPGTYIETKSLNKALKGPLPASYPRTRLTSEQASTPLAEVAPRWEGQEVRKKERR